VSLAPPLTVASSECLECERHCDWPGGVTDDAGYSNINPTTLYCGYTGFGGSEVYCKKHQCTRVITPCTCPADYPHCSGSNGKCWGHEASTFSTTSKCGTECTASAPACTCPDYPGDWKCATWTDGNWCSGTNQDGSYDGTRSSTCGGSCDNSGAPPPPPVVRPPAPRPPWPRVYLSSTSTSSTFQFQDGVTGTCTVASAAGLNDPRDWWKAVVAVCMSITAMVGIVCGCRCVKKGRGARRVAVTVVQEVGLGANNNPPPPSAAPGSSHAHSSTQI